MVTTLVKCVFGGNFPPCFDQPKIPVQMPRGRPLSQPMTLEVLRTTTATLEIAARKGNIEARKNLTGLVLQHIITRSFRPLRYKIGNYALWGLSDCPDLYTTIISAIYGNTMHEDNLITFVRSCLVFLTSTKRFQKDLQWPTRHSHTLQTLLRCCLPTLMSLYTETNNKDVLFEARVQIFIYFRSLLCGEHAARDEFLAQNTALVRICLIEYIYHYITYISPLPSTIMLKRINFKALYALSQTLGEQFRVELNSDFMQTKCIQTTFVNMQQRCQVHITYSAS